jgi:transposase-like protein
MAGLKIAGFSATLRKWWKQYGHGQRPWDGDSYVAAQPAAMGAYSNLTSRLRIPVAFVAKTYIITELTMRLPISQHSLLVTS